MPNAKDLQLDVDSSFLFIGDSGSGKTRLLSTFPKPFVFDFDKGMGSVRGRDVPYETFKDAIHNTKVTEQMKKVGIYEYGKAYPAFVNYLNKLGAEFDKQTVDYRTIGLDSLTTLSQIAMNHVLDSAGRPGKTPQIQDYQQQMGLIESVVGQLTAWPIILVATAHVQRDTNDLQGTIEKLPLLTGKLAGKIGIYFDEIYFTDTDGRGDKKKYVLRTAADSSMRQAHTAIGVPDGVEQDWKHIKAAIDKAAA